MSNYDYQRAMADLMRSPELCRAVRSDTAGVFTDYTLTQPEQRRLHAVASHRGMAVNCTLYRASRLVGITRRLPATVALLGPAFRDVFDAYLHAHPSAEPQFDQEASHFAAFLASRLHEQPEMGVSAEALRVVLAAEAGSLAFPS